jgi:hypothetical protein
MVSWVIFHSWNMLIERAVKNDLADCEETPALEISACITPTRGITSQLATKSEETWIQSDEISTQYFWEKLGPFAAILTFYHIPKHF